MGGDARARECHVRLLTVSAFVVLQGIDQKHIDGTFAQAKRFFELPIEKKMEVCTDKVPEAYFGYFPMARYNRNQKKLNGEKRYPVDAAKARLL